MLNQRRAGARQPDDEDRIGARAAIALARGEEFARANLALAHEAALERAGIIMAVTLFQRVAALIMTEGLGEFAAILERLAQREAQMVAVDDRGGWSCLLGPHVLDFLVREAIGLEVREAPVGVAEARPRPRGCPIGLDRLRLPADSLQGMCDRKVQLRVLGCLRHEVAIGPQGFLVLAESDASRGVKRAESPTGRIDRQKPAGLLQRRGVLVPLGEHLGVVVTGDVIVRRERQHALEQKLGVVEDLELQADLPE